MQQSQFRKILDFLIDNFSDLAALFVAGYTIIYYLFNPPSANDLANLMTLVLAVMGLLAFSGLWDRRRRLERIERNTEESRNLVARKLSGQIQAKDFFVTEDVITSRTLENAKTIYISGYALSRTIRDHMEILQQRLADGATIRIMLLDYANDKVLNDASLRSLSVTPELWRSRIETTVGWIDYISQGTDDNGSIEVGYLPIAPSFGVNIIDPHSSKGICVIEIYHHRSVGRNAIFKITANDDPDWFKFFLNQYNQLWDICRIETLPKKSLNSTKRTIPPQRLTWTNQPNKSIPVKSWAAVFRTVVEAALESNIEHSNLPVQAADAPDKVRAPFSLAVNGQLVYFDGHGSADEMRRRTALVLKTIGRSIRVKCDDGSIINLP